MLSYEITTTQKDGVLKQWLPGPWLFWGLVLLVLPLWMFSFPETTVKHNLKPTFVYASQIFSLLGFAFFALTFVLSTRSKFLEDMFGGLDRVYHFHKFTGKMAGLFLLLHPVFLALRWISEDLSKATWYLLPLHRRMEINLGSWSLMGILVLLIFTFIIKIPYDKWKISHKMLGFFFIPGIFHVFLQNTFSGNPALRIYLSLLTAAGVLAWLYKSIFYDLLKEKTSYLVTSVERLNSKIMEIELSPQKEAERFLPGQFFFFSFLADYIPSESHPFTVCAQEKDSKIKIIVKSLGDYTSLLHRLLDTNVPVLLDGPYGRFTYNMAGNDQVWIAGGVGIAPFLSWANHLLAHPDQFLKVNLFYCVRRLPEATHLHIFQALEEQMLDFHVQVICETCEGLFEISGLCGIKNKDIFICGPGKMRKSFVKDLERMNIPKKQIHFEDFDFN
ncbi:iron reductase [Salinimicrobium marinum]|uniref:Iron reductase n=1 Tax=Salinimicrobium marinum TaxID=680283 RepID=A0A918S6L1_9FLAO|nr:ferric reductase-like transmembrane domain-containing protein [Salinimicrobium marinum]GHA27129.1 iron reductase [Salinimicrobium marinum]